MKKNFYELKYKNKKIAYRYGLGFNSPFGYLSYKFKNNVGYKISKKGLFNRNFSVRKYPVKNFGGF